MKTKTKENEKDNDKRAADVPAKKPTDTPGKDEPFPRNSTIEETNSDADIEAKQTVSGD